MLVSRFTPIGGLEKMTRILALILGASFVFGGCVETPEGVNAGRVGRAGKAGAYSFLSDEF